MVKMNLREAEKHFDEQIEARGLKRVVVHLIEEKISFKITSVYLVNKDVNLKEIEGDEELERICVSWGKANCHPKDQWNRRKGRVIATARALRNFDSHAQS